MDINATSLSQKRNSILKVLRLSYPNAKIALSYNSPWELLVAVILSAQCTDKMVNKVTPTLFATYPTLDAYISADTKEFETLIHSTGFYHNKARHILEAAKQVKGKFKGEVPKTMEEMLTISGVARKTANVVLGSAYGIVAGIAVDTHVIRLSQRLRLVPLDSIGGKSGVYIKKGRETITDFKKDADPVRIEQELMRVIPKNDWYTVTYRLIDHGRAICKATHPLCDECPLSSLCPVVR